ncbi:hypothetical protein ATANTOWER_011533 [Ataeniobius toweri]|uniref:Uncharacterized protein n=1 Tax=Ataeniobius toweri TaxID=208326 RepID=A0ABU7BTN3_9TELE|nr:hypothetical protein [Ataeniobius toweri]
MLKSFSGKGSITPAGMPMKDSMIQSELSVGFSGFLLHFFTSHTKPSGSLQLTCNLMWKIRPFAVKHVFLSLVQSFLGGFFSFQETFLLMQAATASFITAFTINPVFSEHLTETPELHYLHHPDS